MEQASMGCEITILEQSQKAMKIPCCNYTFTPEREQQ